MEFMKPFCHLNFYSIHVKVLLCFKNVFDIRIKGLVEN